MNGWQSVSQSLCCQELARKPLYFRSGLALERPPFYPAKSMLVFDKLISGLAVSPICPRCKGEIPGEDINVGKDLAYCRKCNLTLSLSALASGTVVDEDVDLSHPPAGAWLCREPDGLVIGASNTSVSGVFGFLFFSLFGTVLYPCLCLWPCRRP